MATEERVRIQVYMKSTVRDDIEAEREHANAASLARGDMYQYTASSWMLHLAMMGMISARARRREDELEANGAIARCVTGCWIKDESDHHSSSDGETLCGSCADSMIQEVIDAHNAGHLPRIALLANADVRTNEAGHYIVARVDLPDTGLVPCSDSPISLEVDGEWHIVFVFSTDADSITFARCNVAMSGEMEVYI